MSRTATLGSSAASAVAAVIKIGVFRRERILGVGEAAAVNTVGTYHNLS